jgi:uracil-DNA glycosylase
MNKNIVKKIYEKNNIYPTKSDVFRALELTPFEKIKVVILGQDPYHGEGEANGLAFSVNKGIKLPPSLRNIYRELEEDMGIVSPKHGDLTKWAEEGVLLLNSVLTVEKDKPASHRNIGWEEYTDNIIKEISEKKKNIVFILWGKYAQSKIPLIDQTKHLVIASPHPSPFSARKGFFGSKPFSTTNRYLKENSIEPIDWSIS